MINLPFQEWFSFHSLVGGDWKFFWPENLREILSYSFAWDSSLNTGIGKDNLPFLWLNSYVAYSSHFLTQILHIPWNLAEKIIFFWPIVFISFFSAFFLSKMFLKSKFLNILSGIIYLTNTYALMIFSGGQVGVALAYALTPLVLVRFIKISNLKLSVIAGLVLGLQILFDPRITVLSMIMVAIYFLFLSKRLIRDALFVFIVPLIVSLFLHMFWILPILMSRINLVGTILSESALSSGLVRFLSFANFENTLSLLHPNWPDNVFGKIGFMKPEFVLIPIFAFSSLLFVNNRKILFFAFLGLLGAFLAKGTNPPFGEVYMWLDSHIGLFAMYRDPTKWYVLIAVSYSILIPYGVWQIHNWLKLQQKFQINTKNKILNIQNMFLLITILYLLFLLRPVFVGQVKGTFAQHAVPQEYGQLKDFINKQPEFFRTLWIPKFQRLGFSSNNHPAIAWEELFGQFVLEDKKEILQDMGVKYIIIPFDQEGEIFLKNRKYDEQQYAAVLNKLEKTDFLKRIKTFNKIKVFQLDGNMDHFWKKSSDSDSSLTYIKNSPVKYNVSIKNAKKGDVLVFAEGYSPNWIAVFKKQKIIPMSFDDKINSFYLPEDGNYSLEIYYSPEKWKEIGSSISLISLVLILGFLFTSKLKVNLNLKS